MIVLGLEGTAHTVSCGIVDEGRILSNSSRTYHNPNGGIHPREAAVHHAENVHDVIKEALTSSGTCLPDIDLISYSRGPGLGPCLRIVATAARSLAIKSAKPIVGVNHPLGHVEIGRKLTGAGDPVMLYVSGGNTQIISHIAGRYRVMGETMDIGLGNLLDKLGRDLGYPFPGGPAIEKLAKGGAKLLSLPYSVKGMDTSFSGIYTAARELLKKGERAEDVCFSVQEYTFSMLLEVLERGLHQTSKSEILLAGGVARNQRLRGMINDLSSDLGIKAYVTDDAYCMDNGAMIAQAGLLMFKNGMRDTVNTATVDQRYRIDEVEAPWISGSDREIAEYRGAESLIQKGEFRGRSMIKKIRIAKKYRNPDLDRTIRTERQRNEVGLILRFQDAGARTPVIYDVDTEELSVTYEEIEGHTLRTFILNRERNLHNILVSIGSGIGNVHSLKMTHGDLTTANILISPDFEAYFIDTSMGKSDSGPEDMAVDLFLFMESLKASSTDSDKLFGEFMKGYKSAYGKWSEVMETMGRLELRRRYV